MATDSRTDVTEDTSTWGGATRTVYRQGTGPGVVVLSEIPGITPQVADFARPVVDQGLTVAMPDLFGEAGCGRSLDSVVTDDLIDEPGQPTYEARERVLQRFRDQLLPSA